MIAPPEEHGHNAPRTDRIHGSGDESDYRNEFERDRDRLLYSDAFRRLSGITQVAAVGERHLLHNRLTHSLKVAQIGRRLVQRILDTVEGRELATRIGGISPDVVEAAGLAHDLGHPPFGHIAEDELDRILNPYGGFEGNAQTFRICTRLENHRRTLGVTSEIEATPGLDLTAATLNAIVKYPHTGRSPLPAWKAGDMKPHHQKWNAFDSEKEDFEFARALSQGNESASPEAQLMDWADDISYATHDLEDFYKAGLLSLGRLEEDTPHFLLRCGIRLAQKLAPFDEALFAKLFDKFKKVSNLQRAYRGTSDDKARVAHFVSSKITDFVNAVQFTDADPFIEIPKHAIYEVALFKEFTWYYVIDSPGVATLQVGQMKLIRELHEVLTNWLIQDAQHPRTPVELREVLARVSKPDEGTVPRAVADFICTLTESQAIDLYERMTGTSVGSIFGAWFA